MRNLEPRLGQIGKYWLSKKPGRGGTTDPWCRTWYDEKSRQTRRVSLGTADFRKAGEELARWFAKNERSQNGRREDTTMDSVLIAYWEDHAKALPSAYSQKKQLAKWQEFFAGRSVAVITVEEQRLFRLWLGEGRLRPSTVDKILSSGAAALNFALRMERLESAPTIRLIETREQKESRAPLARPLRVSEMAVLFNNVRDSKAFLYLLLLANTCARENALFDLKHIQFDSESNLLNLNPRGRTQTKKHRPTIPVTSALRPWFTRIEDSDQFVLHNDGACVKTMRHIWRNLAKDTGLNGIGSYSFRHGIAREMRSRGVALDQIKHFLGHKPSGSDITTSIYAPFDPKYCVDAVRALEEIMVEIQRTTNRFALNDPDSVSRAMEAIHHPYKSLSKEQASRMTDLIKAGHTGTHIAKLMGVSSTAVYKRKRRLAN